MPDLKPSRGRQTSVLSSCIEMDTKAWGVEKEVLYYATVYVGRLPYFMVYYAHSMVFSTN